MKNNSDNEKDHQLSSGIETVMSSAAPSIIATPPASSSSSSSASSLNNSNRYVDSNPRKHSQSLCNLFIYDLTTMSAFFITLRKIFEAKK